MTNPSFKLTVRFVFLIASKFVLKPMQTEINIEIWVR